MPVEKLFILKMLETSMSSGPICNGLNMEVDNYMEIVGGAMNPIYYGRIMSYVQLKYRKRYLKEKIAREHQLSRGRALVFGRDPGTVNAAFSVGV